jgi:hypothetical protein
MIQFRSSLAPEVLAKALSEVIYEPDIPVSRGVPFIADPSLTNGRVWYELSHENDHKLDVHGDGTFTFRDRYWVKERLDRVRALLASLGAEIVDEIV